MTQIYSNVFLFIGGQLIAEHVSIETSIERSNNEDIFDMRSGWIGTTGGAFVRRISGAVMVPLSGTEYDFEKAFLNQDYVDILMQEGATGQKCESLGYFTGVTRSSAVGKSYAVQFTFSGTASEFA